MISQWKLWYHSLPFQYITWYRGLYHNCDITVVISKVPDSESSYYRDRRRRDRLIPVHSTTHRLASTTIYQPEVYRIPDVAIGAILRTPAIQSRNALSDATHRARAAGPGLAWKLRKFQVRKFRSFRNFLACNTSRMPLESENSHFFRWLSTKMAGSTWMVQVSISADRRVRLGIWIGR